MDSHHLIPCFFQMRENLVQKKRKKRLWRNASRWQTGLVFIDPRPIPEGSASVDPELGPSNYICFKSSTVYAGVQFRLGTTALDSLQFQTHIFSTMLRWLKNTEGAKIRSREELKLYNYPRERQGKTCSSYIISLYFLYLNYFIANLLFFKSHFYWKMVGL